MKNSMTMTARKRLWSSLLRQANRIISAKYTATEARDIRRAFYNDPAELVCIAARDLRNEMVKRGEHD